LEGANDEYDGLPNYDAERILDLMKKEFYL
jgi:hypothetical protein